MKILRRVLVGSIGASVLMRAALATAQETNEQGRRGFEAMIRPAYGSAGAKSPIAYRRPPLFDQNKIADPEFGQIFSGDAQPYGAGLVGEISAGYRFLPFASAGLYGLLRSSSADAPNDGTKDLSRTGWGAGLYGRFYATMLHERLDPYFQVGVGYAQDTQKFVRPYTDPVTGLTYDVDWELKHHGVVVPFGIGVGYRVLPMLSIGPSFRYDLVLPAGGCLKATTSAVGFSDSFCTDKDDSTRITDANGYGVWSVGLDVKGTL